MDTPNDLMRVEKRQKVSENPNWSKLCPDLLRKIIESLSYLDFYQAKTVCSDWYSVWKTCVKPLYPWRIIYQDDSLMLFDPRDDKLYTTKLLGLSDDSHYMASSRNWLLMVKSRFDFYIFNLVTRKRINLPSLVLSYYVKPCRKDRSAAMWINERTGDYVVAWIFNKYNFFTYKSGDDSWRNWYKEWESDCIILSYLDMACKNSKLYLCTSNARMSHIKIIDFSGDYPKEETENNPYRNLPFQYVPQEWEYVLKTRIVIKKSGEVLIILSLLEVIDEEEVKCLFYVFKMNFENGEWERVYSIGDDELLIYGHGVTIRVPVQDVGDGIKSGSICFVTDDLWPGFACGSSWSVFDLATSTFTWPKKLCDNITKCEWFVPGFA